MLSKNMELHRFVSMQERNRKGSLPLKKRRFQPIKEDLQSIVPADSLMSLAHAPLAVPRPHAAFLPLNEAPFAVPTIGTSDDKIAALALVAAAANFKAPGSAAPTTPLSPAVALSPKPEAAAASAVQPVAPKEDYSTGGGLCKTLATSPSLPEDDDDALHENEEEDSSRHTSGKRVRHRPLLRPLPGGCHGRSSRHNSYCRRLPCYNGSSYCKLHYRQYVLAAGGGNNNKPEVKKAARKLQPRVHPRVTAPPDTPRSVSRRTPMSPKPKPAVGSVSPTNQHQDRRYMGSHNEARCLATTTRGRACAYVSVDGTKYCHLHADYDTNPPPRRGGCPPVPEAKNASGAESPSSDACDSPAFRRVSEGHLAAAAAVADVAAATRPESRHAVSEASVSSIPSVASEDSRRFLSPSPITFSGSKTTPRKRTPSRRTTSKLKEKHADSPFPLLSMISTDQWSHKTVRIATGPFKGRTGEVEKWGNGWVSVQVPGAGLHNRRSFELYLHSEKGAEASAAVPSEAAQVSIKEDEQDKSKSLLFRCVSRDTRSPPLVLPGSENHVAMVTPRPSKAAISMAGAVDSGATLSRFKSIPNHDDAPETPRSDMKPSPIQVRVTPSVQQKTRSETSIPMVDSLMLSSEESSKKYKLDMLFGTAALERSRRSIHKPSRYEDTEMLARKRDRKMLDGHTSPVDNKRQRIHDGD